MFVTEWHITKAIEGIKGASPLAVVTIPALGQAAGSPEQAVRGIPFGSSDEKAFLDRYFNVSGAPDPLKPYRAIWEANENSKKWVQALYPGRSLQAQRKERANQGICFEQIKQKSGQDIWRIRFDAAKDMPLKKPILSIDLAIWLGRNEDISSLSELLEWFKSTFQIRSDSEWDLVPGLYDETIPSHYFDEPLSADWLDDFEISDLVGGLGAPTSVVESLTPLEASIEEDMDKAGYLPPSGLVHRVLHAWIRGDLVVLVGQPGTGKTTFANLIATSFCASLSLEPPLLEPVSASYDETDFLGYESLAGDEVLRQFSREVLKTTTPLEPHVVILEEFNLGVVEQYLSPILIAMEEPSRRVRLPLSEAFLPEDTFLIATCNSYLDESTRNRLSFATKRRCAVFEMPNILAMRVAEEPGAAPGLAVSRILQAKEDALQRLEDGRGSSFDKYRVARWSTVRNESDLSPEVRTRLNALINGLLNTPEGSSYMTFGLLRDIALEIGLADRKKEAELDAFLSAVDSKIIPQLRGEHSNAQPVIDAVQGIPGAEALVKRIDRLKDLDPDQLVTPL